MSLISWNCRGLGSPNAIPYLKYLVCLFNPDLLFLSETLVSRNKIEDLRYLLGFDFCFSVDRSGRGGGLALFWRAYFNCNIVNYSNNHISVDVIDVVHGPWRLTGYYRYPEGVVDVLRGISFDNYLISFQALGAFLVISMI
jgi:hypothetical protein